MIGPWGMFFRFQKGFRLGIDCLIDLDYESGLLFGIV